MADGNAMQSGSPRRSRRQSVANWTGTYHNSIVHGRPMVLHANTAPALQPAAACMKTKIEKRWYQGGRVTGQLLEQITLLCT